MKPSQKMYGPAKVNSDLTDDRQFQGNWIDSFCRCAHPILQKPQREDTIKLDPMPRVDPDKDVQPTGQFEIHIASAALKVHS